MYGFLRINGIAFLVLFLFSCSKGSMLEKLEEIKHVGDSDPVTALAMLDSLDIDVREKDEYTMSKYDLLRIRLNDKADNIPNSDIAIKKLMPYFEENGSNMDKQEVYYYAGSVYRDLQDTPRALNNFFRSLDYATNGSDCDSVMLRNTYSNLTYIYYMVQNYKDAITMAKMEIGVSEKLNIQDVFAYVHLADAYLAVDSIESGKEYLDRAYTHIMESGNTADFQQTLMILLCNYSELGEMDKAKRCLSSIQISPLNNYDALGCVSFAQYYDAADMNDSAKIYCNRVLDEDTDVSYKYDAAKLLFNICRKEGDGKHAYETANKYMQYSDSLDFGKRQELAATVSNQYKYNQDQRRELETMHEKEQYRNILVAVCLVSVLLASIAYALYIKKRNKHLQEVLKLSSELMRVNEEENRLHEDIAYMEQQLNSSKEVLKNYSLELNDVKDELLRVNNELEEKSQVLKLKEQQLAERLNQNRVFMRLISQSELEDKAEEVIRNIKKSSSGTDEVKLADWKQLFHAVDDLYPLFKDRLLKELGTFSEQQMQVCYLMRAGFTKTQIQNMTGLARVTIWRWVKKYDWVMSADK